ncbi:MAG: deaminase [Porticoccaceae bacterium]
METLQEQEDAKWMRLCLDLAKQAADIGEVPVGAIVVREAEILGEGYDQPVTTSDRVHTRKSRPCVRLRKRSGTIACRAQRCMPA